MVVGRVPVCPVCAPLRTSDETRGPCVIAPPSRAAAAISSASRSRGRRTSKAEIKSKPVRVCLHAKCCLASRGASFATWRCLTRWSWWPRVCLQSVKFDPEAPIGCFESERHDRIAKMFRWLRDEKWFQTSIIIVIFVAGILVGIQTYDIQDPDIISVTEYVALPARTRHAGCAPLTSRPRVL